MRASRLILVGLLLSASCSIAGDLFLSEQTYFLGTNRFVVAGEERRGPYNLPHQSIIFHSERVILYGRELVREDEYSIRYDRGEISFPFPLSAGDSVSVEYRYFPLTLPIEKYLNRLRFAEEGGVLLPRENEKPSLAGPLDRGSVRVGGSKSFAVLIGSGRELKLEQALRVSVDGMLAPGVRVTARLTDENLPFQPEGRSERLEELDEVLVKIESETAEATLGDYEVDFQGMEFGRYSRVLKGALGKYKRDQFEMEISGGLARGEFLSIEIRGAEGKQGPYDLLGADSRKAVVAGSEKVWLNGERLKRGEENDYIIDYSFGTLLFNPNRPIESESRIAVDFQATGDEYKRGFFTNRFELRSKKGRYTLGSTFLSERDDNSNPAALILTDEDLDSLALSGDRNALVPSARVAENGGEYDSLGGVFVYAGPLQGEFNVSFLEVGSGNGSYVKTISPEWGREVFSYAGQGAGDHDPMIPLPLPSSHQLFALRSRARPTDGITMDAEVAWSGLDRNTLSSIDDDDNNGTGSSVSLAVEPRKFTVAGQSMGQFALDGSWRRVSDHFEPLGRYRETERDARWMTGSLRTVLTTERTEEDLIGTGQASESRGGETVWEGGGRWTGGKGGGALTLTGNAGRLDQDQFESRRYTGSALFSGGERLHGKIFDERVESTAEESSRLVEGVGVRRSGEASIRLGLVKPSVTIRTDQNDFSVGGLLSSGIRSDSKRYGMSLGRGTLEAEGAATFEEREVVDSVDAGWHPWYEGRTDEFTARWRGAATVSALYRRRAIDYAPGINKGNESNDLSRVEIRHGGFGGMLQGNWNYQVSSEESRPREIKLVPAPADTSADYDSLGNYFPGEGGYNQVMVEGDAVPLLDLEASGSIRIEPRRRKEGDSNRFMEGFRSDTFLRVRERSKESDRTSLILLQPHAFQKNNTTIRGTVLFRQEARWDDRKSDGSIQIRYQREDREVNEYTGLNRDDIVHTFLVRTRIPLGRKFVGEMKWSRRFEKEWSADDPAVALVDDELLGSIVFQPDPAWRVDFPASFRRETEQILEEEITSIQLDPDLSINISTKGRIDGGLTWNRFLNATVDRSRSFLRSRREGLRWNGRFAYDLNRILRSSLSYTGESMKGERSVHRFRAEMRAFF